MSTPATSAAGRGNLTVSQFVAWSGIGRTSAYAEIGAGRLVAMKCGNRTLIAVEDAEAWRAALPRLSKSGASADSGA